MMGQKQRFEPEASGVIPFQAVDQLRKLTHKLQEKGEVSEARTLAAAILEIVQATGNAAFYAETFLGNCPECGDSEELVSIGAKTYAVCHEHRRYWYLGRNYLKKATAAPPGHKPNLLNGYQEAPRAEAFPNEACPCCGHYREHAAWCVLPGPIRP